MQAKACRWLYAAYNSPGPLGMQDGHFVFPYEKTLHSECTIGGETCSILGSPEPESVRFRSIQGQRGMDLAFVHEGLRFSS